MLFFHLMVIVRNLQTTLAIFSSKRFSDQIDDAWQSTWGFCWFRLFSRVFIQRVQFTYREWCPEIVTTSNNKSCAWQRLSTMLVVKFFMAYFITILFLFVSNVTKTLIKDNYFHSCRFCFPVSSIVPDKSGLQAKSLYKNSILAFSC